MQHHQEKDQLYQTPYTIHQIYFHVKMLLFSKGVILQPFLKLLVQQGTGGRLIKGCGRSPSPLSPGCPSAMWSVAAASS